MKRLFAVCALMALAGCDAPSVSPGAVATAKDPGVGSKKLSVGAAVSAFSEVCISTSPDFEAAASKLGATYVQSTKTGTYFHQTLSLSFRIKTGDAPLCSMVFESTAPASTVRAQFSKLQPKPTILSGRVPGYHGAILK